MQIEDLINYAILAPSGHNTQPWKFSIREKPVEKTINEEGSIGEKLTGGESTEEKSTEEKSTGEKGPETKEMQDIREVFIFPDLSRRLPVVDPDDRELYISLGCALENFVIAAEYFGFETEVEYFFDGNDEDFISVRFGSVNAARAQEKTPKKVLYEAISERQSTRSGYDGKPVPEMDLEKLKSVALEDGIFALFVTEAERIEGIIKLVREGNDIQMNDKAFIEELSSWIRFNDSDAEKTRDGIFSGSMGNPSVPGWVGRLVMKFFVNAKSQSEKDEKHIRSSSALLLLLSEGNGKKAWVDTGRSFERLALHATALDIKNAHLNQPCEVPPLKEKLKKLLATEMQPQLLLRLGYSEKMPGSLRRKVEDTLV